MALEFERSAPLTRPAFVPLYEAVQPHKYFNIILPSPSRSSP